MTYVPFLVLAGAICLVFVYEWVFAALEKRWCTNLTKQEGATIYWILIIVVLCCSGFIRPRPDSLPQWFPGFVVAFIHTLMDLDFYAVNVRKPPRGGNRSSSSPKPSPCAGAGNSHTTKHQDANEDEGD